MNNYNHNQWKTLFTQMCLTNNWTYELIPPQQESGTTGAQRMYVLKFGDKKVKSYSEHTLWESAVELYLTGKEPAYISY